MKTTLNAIRSHDPCAEGWKKLLQHLGKTEADDEPLSIKEILSSNGLDDALWCLRAVDGYDKEIRLLAVAYARQVQHLMTDPRSIAALDVAERYAHGQASDDELAEASAAAWDAACDAACDAAGGAAGGAAWAAASAAVRDAACDAVRAAACDAVRAAVRAAVRESQSKMLLEACDAAEGK
jgi:hypothetical protein